MNKPTIDEILVGLSETRDVETEEPNRYTAVMVTHDLREAIFLADRVLVMSPRPGCIQTVVAVDLPRPRRLEVIYTEFFGALARRVREAVQTSRGMAPEVR